MPEENQKLITCPYCFGEPFPEDQVCFRSEYVTDEDDEPPVPEGYSDFQAYKSSASYQDRDEKLIKEHDEWERFLPGQSDRYKDFWENHGGFTTEQSRSIPRSYEKPILDPNDPEDQKYIKPQKDSSFLKRDNSGFVSEIELSNGKICRQRVCPHCHNPLPSGYGKNRVKYITVIGITNSGKTVYISQLLKNLTVKTAQAGLTTMFTNNATRDFINSKKVEVNSPLPGSTPADSLQQPLTFNLEKSSGTTTKVTETLVLYDIAGENFNGTPSDATLAQTPFITHADGIILLIDPMEIEAVAGLAEDGQQLLEAEAVLSSINGIVTEVGGTQKCEIPVAVCISKMDESAFLDSITDDLRTMLEQEVEPVPKSRTKPSFNGKQYNPILQGLYEFIERTDHSLDLALYNQFTKYAYFAMTSLGCDVVTENGASYPVGPIIPNRIQEPLLWLFHQFGYLDTNEALQYPNIETHPCPECGSVQTHQIKTKTLTVKKGLFRKASSIEVNHVCDSCGHEFFIDLDEE